MIQGSGRLTWMDETEQKSVDLRIGDVFRLPFGTIFFIESNLEPARQKLRVYSIFANSGDDLRVIFFVLVHYVNT